MYLLMPHTDTNPTSPVAAASSTACGDGENPHSVRYCKVLLDTASSRSLLGSGNGTGHGVVADG